MPHPIRRSDSPSATQRPAGAMAREKQIPITVTRASCALALGLILTLWTGCATVQSPLAIHAAIEEGKLDRASELIKTQKFLDARDAAGNTALHLTAARGYTNLTEE